MSYTAGIICLYCLNDSYMSFQCFSNLILNNNTFNFLKLDGNIVKYYIKAFTITLNNKDKELANYLESIDLTPDVYLLQWIESIFLKHLPFEICCRIFDNYIYEGTVFLYKVSLSILEIFKDNLLYQPIEYIIIM